MIWKAGMWNRIPGSTRTILFCDIFALTRWPHIFLYFSLTECQKSCSHPMTPHFLSLCYHWMPQPVWAGPLHPYPFHIWLPPRAIFTQILAHKPQNLEILSSQAPNLEILSSQASKFGNFPLTSPPFQRQMSVRKPHTSEIRAAHPYLKKKLSAPPPPHNCPILPRVLPPYQVTGKVY